MMVIKFNIIAERWLWLIKWSNPVVAAAVECSSFIGQLVGELRVHLHDGNSCSTPCSLNELMSLTYSLEVVPLILWLVIKSWEGNA